MLRRLIPAAVAAISLAGLAFVSPASAASLPDRLYGCGRGDFCVYSTEVLSEATKIGIGRGEDWSAIGVLFSPYKNVRSFFNYGRPATEDHVVVSFVNSAGQSGSMCVHRAEDGDVGVGHETYPLPVTVTKIDWVDSAQGPCWG
ncbi:hypothetical protein ACIBQ6_12010 [Nonomuraea sp. NPDC049655]|uniref:hypothetical protein n=1 Tax=Nonomuraea sp. NPDC049655 TaxID=3364355 RepID=UPI0037A91585